MAVLFLAGSGGSGSTEVAASTNTYSYDSGSTGSDRVLIVAVVYEKNTNPADVTAVTYAGDSLTHIFTHVGANVSSFTEDIEFWGIADPTINTNDVVISISQTGRDIGFTAGVWTGAGLAETLSSGATQGITSQTLVHDIDFITSNTDAMLISCAVNQRANAGTLAAAANNTTIATEIAASGNSGFSTGLFERGPEASTGTFNCGSSTVGGNVSSRAAMELLEAAAAGASAVITGTTVPTITEADVVSGGETSIITLTGDTWVAAGGTFDAQRQAIIDGFDAASSPTNGWNNEVRDNEVVTAVVRTSSTIVTVTWTAAGSYDISSTETITCTVPNAALVTETSDIIATPTFTVTAVVSGRIMSSLAGAGGLASLGGIAGKGGGLAG